MGKSVLQRVPPRWLRTWMLRSEYLTSSLLSRSPMSIEKSLPLAKRSVPPRFPALADVSLPLPHLFLPGACASFDSPAERGQAPAQRTLRLRQSQVLWSPLDAGTAQSAGCSSGYRPSHHLGETRSRSQGGSRFAVFPLAFAVADRRRQLFAWFCCLGIVRVVQDNHPGGPGRLGVVVLDDYPGHKGPGCMLPNFREHGWVATQHPLWKALPSQPLQNRTDWRCDSRRP